MEIPTLIKLCKESIEGPWAAPAHIAIVALKGKYGSERKPKGLPRSFPSGEVVREDADSAVYAFKSVAVLEWLRKNGHIVEPA